MYGLSADTSTTTVKRTHQGRDETPIKCAPTVESLAELAHASVFWDFSSIRSCGMIRGGTSQVRVRNGTSPGGPPLKMAMVPTLLVLW